MAYTQVAVSGYNSGPPIDDGTQTTSNRVRWAGIKTKLFDPLRTALGSIDDNIASAITTADATLVTLQTAISVAQSLVNSLTTTLNATSGTVWLFRQTAAPTGWTKGTAHDDKALRIVTGTVTPGGTSTFSSVFAARTIATANLPVHKHTFEDAGSNASLSGTSGISVVYDINGVNQETSQSGGNVDDMLQSINNTNINLAATWSISGSSDSYGSGGTWDFAVRYVDVIYATKQ